MRSEFEGSAGFFSSEEGSNRNMSLLYGLSDFWHAFFEDSDKIDLLLEASSISASDVYSKFLQLTSSITLEDVQLTTGSQLKLIILPETSKVSGSVASYALPDGMVSARYIANRPFLATASYENGPHFFIDADEGVIHFYTDPFQDKFPARVSSEGVREIAMWAVDAEIDEQIMSQYFGNLIGTDPKASTEKYKDFLYGLFYLYTHGPDLAMVRRGLNVALGVPLARDDEMVLSIRKYPGTDQHFVITDMNSYLLPFGLVPTVTEGETLSVGDEITTWVEVKDYVNDGDWWVNLEIPRTILPYVPDLEVDAYAKLGSYADYLMRNYLCHHTFLVKVNVTTFKNIESFQELGEIIRQVKPSYTTPIYIWAVPIEDEALRLIEERSSVRRDSNRCEYFLAQIAKHRRNSSAPTHRGCPIFTRMSLGQTEIQTLGLDPYVNGTPTVIANGVATGYINRDSRFRENTEYEARLLSGAFRRDSRGTPHRRSMVGFTRNLDLPESPAHYYSWREYIPYGMWSVPIHVTTLADLKERFSSIGVPVPDGGPAFTLMQPYLTWDAINSEGINEGLVINQFQTMVSEFSKVFTRGNKAAYVGGFIPDYVSEYSFKPQVFELKETDFFLCTQIYEETYAVYWITSSTAGSAKEYLSYMLFRDPDTLSLRQDSVPMTRGMGASVRAPAYTTRGGEARVTEVQSGEGINEDCSVESRVQVNYTDIVNLNTPRNRGSAKINIDAILG